MTDKRRKAIQTQRSIDYSKRESKRKLEAYLQRHFTEIMARWVRV